MCLNVVLEVNAERQHEEGRSEEDGGTGVRAGTDGGRERGGGWYRKGEGERERKRLERKRRGEKLACVSQTCGVRKDTESQAPRRSRGSFPLCRTRRCSVSFSSAPTSAFSRPHLPLYIWNLTPLVAQKRERAHPPCAAAVSSFFASPATLLLPMPASTSSIDVPVQFLGSRPRPLPPAWRTPPSSKSTCLPDCALRLIAPHFFTCPVSGSPSVSTYFIASLDAWL